MEIIKGNLVELAASGTAGIIVHGCNCFHAMGSGIAGQLAKRFPEIPNADFQTVKGDPSKLGIYTEATVTKETIWFQQAPTNVRKLKKPFKCINLYTQYNPGADFIPSVLPYALGNLNKDYYGETLWFPRIGAGIGGGDWLYIEDCMLKYLTDVNVKVVVYG